MECKGLVISLTTKSFDFNLSTYKWKDLEEEKLIHQGFTTTVRLSINKDYFIGKYALQHQKERGVTKKLVMFHVENIDPDSDIWPWGGEPLYRNNQFVGTVTSAGYGFTTDKLVCLGFIQKPDTMNHSNITNKTVPEHNQQTVTEDYIMDKNATYQIDIAGQRFPLTPHIYAPHFPNESHGIKKTYRPTVVSLKRESLQ